VKVVLSQVTGKSVNELCELPIEDFMSENTESHSLRLSKEVEGSTKTFNVIFSTTQLTGKKNFEKKTKLQLELYDSINNKLIARSKTFALATLLKGITGRKSLRRTSVTRHELVLNNMVSNQMMTNMNSDEYSKAIAFNIIAMKKVESIPVFKVLTNREMKIIPVFGLDFSQANLTFDDDICLHRTKEDKPKIYLKLMENFAKILEPICTDYCIPYVFGCKATPGAKTSDCLALSGDYFKPEVKFTNIKKRYVKTVNQIEFALPPNHCEIFNKTDMLARLARQERLRNPFVHLHITPGLIEDYTELVKNICNRADHSYGKLQIRVPLLNVCNIGLEKLPITVIIIRLKFPNLLEDDVDVSNLPKDLQASHKNNKTLVHIFDLDIKADDAVIEELINEISKYLI
jgi:hypothetical protein